MLSITSRTPRSRTSVEYLLGLPMAPSSQHLEPPGNPGRFTRSRLVCFDGSDAIFTRGGGNWIHAWVMTTMFRATPRFDDVQWCTRRALDGEDHEHLAPGKKVNLLRVAHSLP